MGRPPKSTVGQEVSAEKLKRLVNPEDAMVSAGNSKKILVWCDESVNPEHTGMDRRTYEQSAGWFVKGSNGCTWCGYMGEKSLIAYNLPHPDFINKLVNPQDAYTVKSGGSTKINIKCSGDPENDTDHDEEIYTQAANEFCGGINRCPGCNNRGYIHTIGRKHPDYARRLVYEKDKLVMAGSRAKVTVWCDGTGSHDKHTYKQAASDLTKGVNGCSKCNRWSISSIMKDNPSFYKRLAHPEIDGGMNVNSAKDVLAWCDGIVQGNTPHVKKTYSTKPYNNVGNNSCPVCNRDGIANSLGRMAKDRSHRVVNSDDLSVHYRSHDKIMVWCDGEVEGLSAHPRREYPQVTRYFTGGRVGCPLCSKNTAKIAEKTKIILSALVSSNTWHLLSDVERAVIVKASFGINPNSDGGRKLIEGDQDTMRELIDQISEDDSDADQLFVGDDDDELDLEDMTDSEEFDESDELPDVSIKDGFIHADEALSIGSEIQDQTSIDFLVYSQVAKAWRKALSLPAEKLESYIRELHYNWKSNVIREAKKEFLRQYRATVKIKTPANWGFYEPNLMQKYIAFLVKERKKVGNWSGVGAGKTGSAVLSAKVVKAKNILVVCPNNTLGSWEETIKAGDPSAQVQVKTDDPVWKGRGAKWLVVNPETLRGAHGKKVLDGNKFDMVVIDEVHWMKERKGVAVSQRRKMLMDIRRTLGEDDYLLAMSATPVINHISEGASLVEIIDGVKPEIGNKVTENNVLLLHMNLVRIGTRAIIPPAGKLNDDPLVDIDVSELNGQVTKKMSHFAIERKLAPKYIPMAIEIAQECKARGKGLLIYSEFREGIIDPYQKALEAAGLKVARFVGGEEKATIRTLREDGVDVLIGTRAISTGVDGVQMWTDTIFYATLPWTDAEFEQSRGRVYRQGQVSEETRIVIPNGIIDVGADEPWSWTKFRWARIQHKKNVAQAAVSGVLPKAMTYSIEETKKAAFDWKERLEKEAGNDGE